MDLAKGARAFLKGFRRGMPTRQVGPNIGWGGWRWLLLLLVLEIVFQASKWLFASGHHAAGLILDFLFLAYLLFFAYSILIAPLIQMRHDLNTRAPQNVDRNADPSFPNKTGVEVTCEAADGTLAFPKICPCCGGKADREWDLETSTELEMVKYRGQYMSVTTKKAGYRIPFCSTCLLHIDWVWRLKSPRGRGIMGIVIRPSGPLLLLTMLATALLVGASLTSKALNSLELNSSIAAGVAIVLMAIVLDVYVYRRFLKPLDAKMEARIIHLIRSNLLTGTCCTDGSERNPITFSIENRLLERHLSDLDSSPRIRVTMRNPEYLREFVSLNHVVSEAEKPGAPGSRRAFRR